LYHARRFGLDSVARPREALGDRFRSIHGEFPIVNSRERIDMEQLKGLPLGRQLILGAGVLLFIDMFFAWQSVDVGPFSVSRNGWHGFWGILLALLTLVLVAWVLVRAFGIEIPVNVPDGLTSLALGALILLFALIKNLSDDYSTVWSYIGIVLAAVVAYGGWLVFQASGESLPRVAAATAGAPAGMPDASADDAPPPASEADAT